VNTQLVGLRYIQTDNQSSLPAYALVNAQWRYPAVLNNKGLVIDVGIQTQNLTQTQYFSMPGRPMPGRSVQFTLWIQTVSKSHAKTVN
jgi:hypothetical protein